MSINPFEEKGVRLDKQFRTWKQIAQLPYRKQEVDAYTRCRVILMNGIETESILFSHNFARNTFDNDLKGLLATMRRVDSQQQTTINWLNPFDQTVLETTIAYEQVAVDLTAYLARTEPDPYLKEVLHFGLLEDFDHLYRYSQVLDIVEGKDPEEITQGKTDIFPGRPTQDHHNDPILRLREHYSKNKAHPISKANILTVVAAEQQTMMYYREHGFQYGGQDVRELYAEIAEVEEEHVTQYESLMDPTETWMEKWLMHEFVECANYYACYSMETDPRIKQIWELFLSYELEHLRLAGEAIKKYEDKDPEEICGSELPTPGTFEENKEYVADVLFETVNKRLMPNGEFAAVDDLPSDWASYIYQATVNAEGSPSEQAVRYRMMSAGKELLRAGDDLMKRAGEIRLSLDKEITANTAPQTAEELTSQAELLARRASASGRD
jgi:Mn-containing catalase